mmetsp:Transcript_11788/g.25288  ORF Transcript_11788/g.25288 Transcript_11788/m.25288 type:complete len:200 (+) Transcript_11788:1241-1840(+)
MCRDEMRVCQGNAQHTAAGFRRQRHAAYTRQHVCITCPAAAGPCWRAELVQAGGSGAAAACHKPAVRRHRRAHHAAGHPQLDAGQMPGTHHQLHCIALLLVPPLQPTAAAAAACLSQLPHITHIVVCTKQARRQGRRCCWLPGLAAALTALAAACPCRCAGASQGQLAEGPLRGLAQPDWVLLQERTHWVRDELAVHTP